MKVFKFHLLKYSEKVFDTLKHTWKNQKNKYISFTLVFVFIITNIFSYVDINNIINLDIYEESFSQPFFHSNILYFITASS